MPTGHATQEVAPEATPIPSGSLLSAAVKLPRAHEMQSVACSSEYWPDTQLMQLLAASSAENFPAAQAEQSGCAEADAWPGTHAIQLPDPAGAYRPLEQSPHAMLVVAPTVDEDLPAAQPVQEASPVCSAYHPATQLVQLVLPFIDDDWPSAQAVHELAPADEKRPAGQGALHCSLTSPDAPYRPGAHELVQSLVVDWPVPNPVASQTQVRTSTEYERDTTIEQ